MSKEFESTKELEAVAKFDQNIFSILLQLDALVVGENMLLVKRSFSNLDLLHPVLRARQSWQILFNARTVQLASWGGRGEDCQRYDDDFMSMRKMVLYTFHL